MTETKIRTAFIAENGKSNFSVDMEVSGHKWQGDEPESDGGKNLGPAPYDTLLAALGECTSMTVRWYALKEKWPLEKVEVKLTHHKNAEKTDVFTKQVILYGANLTETERAKLLEVADKCPVHRSLEKPAIITTAES